MKDKENDGVSSRAPRRSTQTATLADVAKLANVSSQTVSRAIRTPEAVLPGTLERIRAAIDRVGYLPKLPGGDLNSMRSFTVASIVPNLSESLFAETLDAMSKVLSPHGYHLLIGCTDHDPQVEEDLIRTLLMRRPDGIFLTGSNHTATARQLLEKARIPVVETWYGSEGTVDSFVGFSRNDALRFLIKYALANGARHPTFAGHAIRDKAHAIERRDTYVDTVLRALPDEPVRFLESTELNASLSVGRQLLNEALQRHPETDLLVCSSDIVGAGALLQCQRRGIEVPTDIGITGFGGHEISRDLTPPLTTVYTPGRRIGSCAGALLLDKISNVARRPASVNLGFRIVPGGSIRRDPNCQNES